MGKDVIIACDFASKADVMNFLDKFTDCKPFARIFRSFASKYPSFSYCGFVLYGVFSMPHKIICARIFLSTVY